MRHFYIAPMPERWSYAVQEARERQAFEGVFAVLGAMGGVLDPIQPFGRLWSAVLFALVAWVGILLIRIVYALWQAPVVLGEKQFRELDASYEKDVAKARELEKRLAEYESGPKFRFTWTWPFCGVLGQNTASTAG